MRDFRVGNRSAQDPDGPISEVFALDRQEPMGEDCLGAMQDRYELAHRMSAAFTSFARTGVPRHTDLPAWPAFNARTYPTMIFGNDCKVVNDPNREDRLALKAIREGA